MRDGQARPRLLGRRGQCDALDRLLADVRAGQSQALVLRGEAGEPLNGMVEVAGLEQYRFDELVRNALAFRHDPRQVVADPGARYFGALLGERTIAPDDGARLGETRFDDWLAQQA